MYNNTVIFLLQILKAMSAKVTMNLKLEQDSMEGVDDSEWDQ